MPCIEQNYIWQQLFVQTYQSLASTPLPSLSFYKQQIDAGGLVVTTVHESVWQDATSIQLKFVYRIGNKTINKKL